MLPPDLEDKTTDSSHAGQAPVPAPRQHKGLRTGALLVLTMLLAVVFGTGLFAGWTFATTGGTGAGALQSGTNPQERIPSVDRQ